MKITVMRTYSSTKDRVRKIPNAVFAQFLFCINDYSEKFAENICFFLGTNIDLNLPEKCHMDTKPRTSLSDDCSTATSSGAQFDTDEVTSQLLKVRLLCRDLHCIEILEQAGLVRQF